MNKSKVGGVIAAVLFALYALGVYTIIADDHRYTTKDVALAIAFFPYPWWVGAKELYYLATTSSKDREFDQQCLDALEAQGVSPGSRLRYCSCMVETRNFPLCKKRLLAK